MLKKWEGGVKPMLEKLGRRSSTSIRNIESDRSANVTDMGRFS